MKDQKRIERWALGSVVIGSGLILLFNLWARTLENHDYLRYAEVAREMIRSGEWVVPHYNGEIFIDKPPLLFWFIAIPASLYGAVTPLIARLPSALSAYIGVIILFYWGKRIYGTIQSGLIAAGMLLSSYQYFFQARIAKTDMVLCLFILLSLYFFFLGYHGVWRRRYLLYGFSFFSMGLAILTKGPFGLVPLLLMAVYLVKEGESRKLIGKEFILGWFILMLTVLSWVFLFIHRVGLDQSMVLLKENQILTRHEPIYFYLSEIWAQFFPWSLLIPFLAISLWKQRRALWNSKESFFLVWFSVIFILLTLFKYRASRYLLPALPAFALMTAGMLNKKWSRSLTFFLIPFLFFSLTWHGVELYWIGKNLSHSPGMVLVQELRPVIKDSTLLGYRLDVSTVEEINFYLERVIPVLKKAEDLSDPLRVSRRGFVLMPKEVYEAARGRKENPLLFVQEFDYKKGGLVLASL